MIESLAFNYADGMYEKLKNRLEQQLRKDVENEVQQMAWMYSRFIIGLGGRMRGPIGNITSRAPGGPGMNLRSATGEWARRSRKYLQYKRNHFPKHDRWFEYGGKLQKGISKKSTWLAAFGPVRVKLTRNKNFNAKDPAFAGSYAKRLDAGRNYGHLKVGVGKVEVFALRDVTPAMLPALISGRPTDIGSSDGRLTGLTDLIYDVDPELGYRIAGRQDRVPYRPTLEPFLAFALTRSIPYAVQQRIVRGLNARLLPGDAGRGRAGS